MISFPATGAAASTPCCSRPRATAILVEQAGRHARPLRDHEPAPRGLLAGALRQGLVRGLRAGPSTSGSRTGGTDDFETKFSLVPLVFGTIKGTFYALLFAIPLAVLGALYTSQFMHPQHQGQRQADGRDHGRAAQRGGRLHRRPVARPARRARVVPVLLMVVLLPLFGTAGRAALGPPARAACATGCKPGMELALILPLLLAGRRGSRCRLGPWRRGGVLRRATSRLWLHERHRTSSTTSATAWWWAWPWASR